MKTRYTVVLSMIAGAALGGAATELLYMHPSGVLRSQHRMGARVLLRRSLYRFRDPRGWRHVLTQIGRMTAPGALNGLEQPRSGCQRIEVKRTSCELSGPPWEPVRV
jgi:hypothetical protein